MLNKIINALQELPDVKFNKIWGEEVITEAKEMFELGWDNLADGTVISFKGNRIVMKKGDTVVRCESDDFSVRKGRLIGSAKELKTIELTEDGKEQCLAQAIVTRYYTITGW